MKYLILILFFIPSLSMGLKGEKNQKQNTAQTKRATASYIKSIYPQEAVSGEFIVAKMRSVYNNQHVADFLNEYCNPKRHFSIGGDGVMVTCIKK